MSLQTVIDHLKLNMPGQSEEWYLRVATQIREANGDLPIPETPKRPDIKPSLPPLPSLPKFSLPKLPKTTGQRVNPETRKRLINMCGGDVGLAERLALYGTQEDWERAIYQLERDRR